MSDVDVSARGAGPARGCEPIRKRPGSYARANLQNYDELSRMFSWADARALLDGFPGGGLNIAYEAVDRHVIAGRGGKLALRCIGRDDRISDFTYMELCKDTNRFANVLAAAGIGKGDSVFALLGRVPALYIAALGTLKNGSVFSPLFSAQVYPAPASETRKPKRGLAITLIQGAGVHWPGSR